MNDGGEMMTIVMLAEVSAASVVGGAERMLREQAIGLERRGHEVRIVARAPVGDARSAVTLGGAGEGRDVIEYRYPVSRWNEPMFVLSSAVHSLRAFDRLCRADRPEVVLIHQSLAALGPILCRRARVRTWVYVCLSLAHEEYRSRVPPGTTLLQRLRRGLNARLRRWCERIVMGRCARIIVMSEFMKQRVHETHGMPEGRMLVLPGCADLARFRPPEDRAAVRRELTLPHDGVILLAVRNLVPRMGLDNLLHAIARLRRDEPDVVRDMLLLIGGDGPLRAPLERLIAELGLGDHVRLLGFIAEGALPRHYQAADLVLMPTHELEGFGLVMVEALACGTPVLGTPVGALPEVLARLDPQLIAEGSDAEALAGAIQKTLRRFRDHAGERPRLAAKGRALVAREYNWNRYNERLEQVLREVGTGC